MLMDSDVAALLHEVFSDENVIAFLVEDVEDAVVDLCIWCSTEGDVDVGSERADGSQWRSGARCDGVDRDWTALLDDDVWAVLQLTSNVQWDNR